MQEYTKKYYTTHCKKNRIISSLDIVSVFDPEHQILIELEPWLAFQFG